MKDKEAVCHLLERLKTGGSDKANLLLPLVYDELKALARRQMSRQKSGHTLQTTALVHEAWIRLARRPEALEPVPSAPLATSTQLDPVTDRAEFLRLACAVMRHILIDHARMCGAQKRGGGNRRVEFDENCYSLENDASFPLSLDESVERLLKIDQRMGRMVELRCFGGLNHPEIAEALHISTRQVDRTWRAAKAWLRNEFEMA